MVTNFMPQMNEGNGVPVACEYFLDNDFDKFCEMDENGKVTHVTGYITSNEFDAENQLLTKNALSSILNQLKNKNYTFDIEHSSINGMGHNSQVPVAKVADSGMDDKGIWVKAQLNPYHSRYDEFSDSLRGGFYKGFSITGTVNNDNVKSVNVNGNVVSAIEDWTMSNIGFTGAPMNPDATLGGVPARMNMKSAFNKAITTLLMKNNYNKVVEEQKPLINHNTPVEEKKLAVNYNTNDLITENNELRMKSLFENVELRLKSAIGKVMDEVNVIKSEIVKTNDRINEIGNTPLMKGIQQTIPNNEIDVNAQIERYGEVGGPRLVDF